MKFGWILPHLGCFGSIREAVELSNALIERGNEVTIHTPEGTPCKWLSFHGAVRQWEESASGDEYDLMLLVSDWKRTEYNLLLESNAKRKGVVLMGFAPTNDLAETFRAWPYAPPDVPKVLNDALHNPDVLIFADGVWQLTWMQEHVGIKPAIAIGGVNTRMFHPFENRHRGVTIGATGDPRDRKGMDTVLEAVKIIRKKHGNLDLRTYWGTDTQEHLAAWYQETTIFLDGHRRGGWCNPVLEAMASGCAVVCTDIGATEFVIDGENGRRVPVDDPKAMADRVLWYLGSVRRVEQVMVNAVHTAAALDYRVVSGRLQRFMERELEHSAPAAGDDN